MKQWKVINDRIVDFGDVPYLGVHERILRENGDVLPEDYDGWFPFMRFSLSIGDFGVVSGLYEAMKKKYPKIQIAVPKFEFYQKMLPWLFERYNLGDKVNVKENYKNIMLNNPYIDYYFDLNEFDIIFSDHDRSFIDLIETPSGITCKAEPLVEQILRRFGFTEDDIVNIDSRPKLYFSDEEKQEFDEIIKTHVGDSEFGSLLLASRIPKFRNQWNDDLLIDATEPDRDKPVFYYADFDLAGTRWDRLFSKMINLKDLDLSIRAQLYLKYYSDFQYSYQAGITDSTIGGDSRTTVLCPYDSIRENCGRGVKYLFLNGDELTIEIGEKIVRNYDYWHDYWKNEPSTPIHPNPPKEIYNGTREEPAASMCLATFMEPIKNKFKDGFKILDYGCGQGALANFISKRLDNFKYIGLEPNYEWGNIKLETARQYFSDDRVEFGYCEDILDYKDSGVDAIMLLSIFTHLDEAQVTSILDNLIQLYESNDKMKIIFSTFIGEIYRLNKLRVPETGYYQDVTYPIEFYQDYAKRNNLRLVKQLDFHASGGYVHNIFSLEK
jgi:SAM-dependent methyltransferase